MFVMTYYDAQFWGLGEVPTVVVRAFECPYYW